jgi:hypothetical protein
MPQGTLSLPRSVIIRQLGLLVKHADVLPTILEQSKKIEPSISVDDATQEIAKVTKIDASELRGLFNAVDQLSEISKNLGSLDKAFDRVIEICGKENLAGLDEKRAAISKAIHEYYDDNNPVAISVKAQRLVFAREKLLIDAEIITDARPVYDSSGKEILEFIITHSLVATYHTGGEDPMAIHLSMDAADIEKLRKACERAVIKAHTLKEHLGKNARVVGDAK